MGITKGDKQEKMYRCKAILLSDKEALHYILSEGRCMKLIETGAPSTCAKYVYKALIVRSLHMESEGEIAITSIPTSLPSEKKRCII